MTVTPLQPSRFRLPPSSHPPAPVFATTKNATADAILSTLDQAVAPLRELPNSDDGAAGKVSKAVGGALGVINAPAMFIDTAASIGASNLDKFLASKLGLPTLFPALPVARIGVTLHMGTPHTHVHPPSTTPPAPPIPLPSFGVAFLAGSASVLVNGIPALRAGDVGIGFTCGSAAPPFEIMTGAAGVYFAGARVARIGMDITFHCNPSPASAAAAAKIAKPFMNVGKFAAAMGAAGAVAGAAGAIDSYEKGNTTAAAVQAIQTGLDAAALALSMLRGKDPAGPPGVGMLIGPPPNVQAGGAPIPNIGAWAQGKLFRQIGRALGGLKNKLRRQSPSADANGHCGTAGHPVNLITGENFDTYTDFKSFHGGFTWQRHMTSAWAREPGRVGPCFKHLFETRLTIRLHRVTYFGFAGERIDFPRLTPSRREVAINGYRLTWLSETRFQVSERRLGMLEFERANELTNTAYPVASEKDKARTELFYSDNGLLTEIREYSLELPSPLAVYALAYDSAGRLAELHGANLTDGDSRSPSEAPRWQRLAAYAYDSDGRLISAEDPLGACETYEFDRRHRLVRATNRAGYSFRWTYDCEDRCVASAGEDGLWSVLIEYAPELRQTRVTFHHGGTRLVHYDEDGVVTKVVDARGAELERLRGEDGRVLAEVDGTGHRMLFLYGADGANIGRVDRFGHRYLPELDQPHIGNPFERHPPENARDRQIGALALATAGRARVFDSIPPEAQDIARELFVSPPPALFDHPVRSERDAYGRITRETDALGHSRAWQYDSVGNEIARVDRDGRLYQQRFTSWRLLTERVDPLGHVTSYAHDPHENITRVVDPLGTVSEYAYDQTDRLICVRRHGRVREEYVRDPNGRLIEKRGHDGTPLLRIRPHANSLTGCIDLADGGAVTFDYDSRGLVIDASTQQHRVSQAWDDERRLLQANFDGRQITHQYESGHRVLTRIGAKFAISYRRSTPTHDSLLRSPSGADQLTIVAPNGFAWTLLRGEHGLVRLQHGESFEAAHEIQQYSREGRLLGRLVWRSLPDARRVRVETRTWSTRYQYSPEGDLLEIHDSERGQRAFSVDAAHRLTVEITADGRRLQYPLDEAGNLLSKPDLPLVRVGSGNRLQHAGFETFRYDARDHLAERWSSTHHIRYEHDSLDRLVAVYEDGRQSSPWTATYDGLGRRLTSGRGDRRTLFWWDDDRIAAETSADGALRIYIYAHETALVPIGFVDYDSVDSPPESGRAYSVFSDQVGLPLVIEDQNGHVAWRAQTVEPYGRIDVAPESKIDYHLRWPGHYLDADTGLHYNRFRYYDPGLGRYVESDPIGCAGGINLYAYASNPLVAVDVLGLTAGDCKNGGSDDPEHTNPTEKTPKQGDPPNETPEAKKERLRQKREEMARRAAEREEARKREDAQRKQEQQERDRRRNEVAKQAEDQALDAAMSDPEYDPARQPIVGEGSLQSHLGHPRESGVKMPEFGYYRKDGTFVVVEVKNQNHPDAGHAVQKFEQVSEFANESVNGQPREPKTDYVLAVPEWAGDFSDPNYQVTNGTLHNNGTPVLVDGKPIQVVQQPFPRPEE